MMHRSEVADIQKGTKPKAGITALTACSQWWASHATLEQQSYRVNQSVSSICSPLSVCVRMCDFCNCNHSLCGLLRTRPTVCVCVCTCSCRRSSCIHVCLAMTQASPVQAGTALSWALIELPPSAAWLQTDPGECVTAPSSPPPPSPLCFPFSSVFTTYSN